MYSFSSASQMCDPFPRTINGGSPPTAPNALTGEFTPPGIMLSARFCRRRDCSTFRDVIDGIDCSVVDCHPEQASFAPRGIWASRAKRRVLCDATIAGLARFLIEPASGTTVRPTTITPPHNYSNFHY